MADGGCVEGAPGRGVDCKATQALFTRCPSCLRVAPLAARGAHPQTLPCARKNQQGKPLGTSTAARQASSRAENGGPLTRLLYHDRLPRRHQPAARQVTAEDAHAARLLRLLAHAAELVLHQHQLVERVRLARHAHEGEAPGQPAAARHDLHQRQRGVLLQREDRDRVMPAIRRVQEPSVCRDADLGGVRGPVVCDTGTSGGETSR